MRVVIAVDGSAGSFEAAQFVGRLLSAEKDEVLLYYSPPAIQLKTRQPVGPQLADRVQQLLDRAVFDEAKKRLPENLRAGVREVVGTQKPAHGILVAADENRADLIVVGARGSGSLSEVAVGSVARALAHHGTVPVLVVRKSAVPAERLRVLLASDGSPSSRHAAEVVSQFTWPAHAAGRVLTVVENPLAGQMAQWLQDWLFLQAAEEMSLGHFEPSEAEQQHVREDVVRWCGQLPPLFQQQPPLISVGHASEEIMKAIETQQANLVIVGARGLSAAGRLLLGSTSEHLLLHAPCSVLIVRQHERP